MKQLSDEPVSVTEREKIRRLLRLYMQKFGKEDGTPLTTYTTADRINDFLDKEYGGSANPDGSRILSRNAIGNLLKGTTHTPDKKVQGIKAFLLAAPDFVKAGQLGIDKTIERAALALCEFYEIKEAKPATSEHEQHHLFTASQDGMKLTFEFSVGMYHEAGAKTLYTPAHGVYSYLPENGTATQSEVTGFNPIRCEGFGIVARDTLHLYLRSTVRRTPLSFVGSLPSKSSREAWLSIAPALAELARAVPHVYHGEYRALSVEQSDVSEETN
jgi:hypothetical protein